MSRDKRKNYIEVITHTEPKSPITEQYRIIRTNIQFSSVDKGIKTIVITSPEWNDGKSTTASNLAVVFAQQGERVLLIDADLRRPSIHYAFKINNSKGLTSILTNQSSLKEAILQTEIPNLDILISGPIPPDSSKLISSKKMESIIEELRGEYGYVILDTPPILAVADSQILVSKCDGVIMVLNSGKTTKQNAVKAKELLNKGNAVLLGAILNGNQPNESNYYY